MDPRSNLASSRSTVDWRDAWRNAYPHDTGTALPYPHMPISGLLARAARDFPNHAACTLFGEATSYAQLDEQARRLASSLIKMGAKPGRFVGMLLPNIPEYLVALQATWLTGATALQLSPLMVAEEVGHWLQATDCSIVVTLDLLTPAVMGGLGRGALEHVIVSSLADKLALWRGWLYRIARLKKAGLLRLRNDAHCHRFDHLLTEEPLSEQVAVQPEEDLALLAPTGGTTASPKAVMTTHRNLVAQAFQLRNWAEGPDGVESVLGVLPFFHSYGLSVALLTAWAKASTVHLYPRYDARAVLALLERERVDIVPAVPAMLNTLNIAMRKKKHDLSFIRAVISGASALDSKVRAEFESHGARDLVEGYGLTEASPVTHSNPPGAANRPGTIGLPVPDTEARIMDQFTGDVELPDGDIGELVVRGPQVMKGYYHNPEATAAVLRDGWLYTGDLARRDRDGYFTIVDRKKDIIKTSGFLVFPAEVEEVIAAFPGVLEAAVVGVPDAEKGELIKALVVPRGSLDIAALQSHCRQHLGKHKQPRQIELVSELPKNFLGKVLRRKLRETNGFTAPEPPAAVSAADNVAAH
jgi:long-chain acyl-CoA synthetase